MQRSRAVAYFIITSLLLILPALSLIYAQEKLELHAWLNQHHAPAADLFFSVVTHVGDGIVPVIFSILLLIFKDLRSFMMMGLSTGISALIVQFMKRMIFDSWDRPFMHKEQLGEMGWVLGIEMNHHFSFPSGHATCAFSMCLALVVIAGKMKWSIPLALLAALIAFSRVYLSQHFMEDIAAGSLIGIAVAGIFHLLLYKGRRATDDRFDRRPFRKKTGDQSV